MRLKAHIEDTNPRHCRIGVWQDGGKAGTLTVEAETVKDVVRGLELAHAAPLLLEACKAIRSAIIAEADAAGINAYVMLPDLELVDTAIAQAEGEQ